MKIDVQIINCGDIKKSNVEVNSNISPSYRREENQITLMWPSVFCEQLILKVNQVYNQTPFSKQNSPEMWNEVVNQLHLTSKLKLSPEDQIFLCKKLYVAVKEYVQNWLDVKKWINELPHDTMFTDREWKQICSKFK